MKIGRMCNEQGAESLALVLRHLDGLQVLDVGRAARAAAGEGRPDGPVPTSMPELIAAGERGLDAVRVLADWALRDGEPDWFQAEATTPWLVPVAVRNCIAAGRNFQEHREEGDQYWKSQGVDLHTQMPSAFAKLPHVMVPTRHAVARPADVVAFDYEVEVAAVIGRPASCVSEERALDAVFGYTVLNDLSAREWQRAEMKNQMILLGKNFPGFGPIGPWILTADEVPDPSVLELELRVNGELRQKASCADLIFDFPRMIAHWSRMGLDVGDLITTGSPAGVAISRQPDPAPYFLKPGDTVHASVRQIGVLETSIV